MGEKLSVEVDEIDDQGRINLRVEGVEPQDRGDRGEPREQPQRRGGSQQRGGPNRGGPRGPRRNSR